MLTNFTNIGIIQIQEEKVPERKVKPMKRQKNKSKKANTSPYKPLRIIPIALALIFILTFSVSAYANNAFNVENCNKIEEYSVKLGEEISNFIELDTNPKKELSALVSSAVNEYRKLLLELQGHPEVNERSLENEMLLTYTQGSSAGRLAWVYYYNIYTFTSDASADKISAKYEACKSVVSNASQYTVLAAECEVMLDELNKLIYTERANNLSLPTDSLTASSLISGSIDKFKTFFCSDLFAEDYAKEYEALVSALELQRVRDSITAESEKVFKSIKPNESFSTSYDVSLLVHKLETAESIKSMNDAALDFVSALLAIDEAKPYSSKVKKEYLSLSQTAALRASESNSAASISPLFTEYSSKIKKAEAKDSIYALLLGSGADNNESLVALEKSYNGDGGIIDNCATDAATDAALLNAKADLFRSKHSEILNKQLDALTKEDEALAKNALIEYTTLEATVKQRLISDINIIAEKYNNALIKKMRDFLPNDALYLDLCETIENELNSLSRDSIDDFYNKASRIPQKAEALAAVMAEYRRILSEENYSSYETSEKNELLETLSALSETLNEINPADTSIYSDEISYARSVAIRALNITDQTARVRIATRNSQSSEVLKELNAAKEKIKLCADKTEMTAQANIAIYKIQRLLTSDAISKNCKNLSSAVNAMQFLESAEKENFTARISALSSLASNAKEAENLTVLQSIWESFSESLSNIKAEAEAIDLSRAITAYLQKVVSDSKEYAEKLKTLQYISEESSDEIYNDILDLEKEAKAAIPNLKSTAEVTSYYTDFTNSLAKLNDQANKSDLEGYKAFLLKEFDKYEKIKSNYSEEKYNQILEIKRSAEEKLKSASAKSECDSIINSALNEALLVNDLLDDEKESALTSLLNLLEALKKESTLYSAESFAKIEGFYDEGKIEIGKINDIEKIAEVKQTLSKYISLMKGINKDCLYTSDSAHSITTPDLQYPEDYNYSNGLLGSVYLKGGLVSDAKLTIDVEELTEKSKIEKLIRKAAKNGTLITYQSVSKETLKLLRSASVATVLDVSLSSVAESASGYTLQMLIPNELSGEKILGLAFIDGDEVEFYPVTQEDSLITTELQHFSKYYIVVESTLNVKPLLIALIILISAEFLVLIAIIYLKRKKYPENDDQEKSDLPTLPTLALIPFSSTLTRVYPENGIMLSILLSAAAVALGITIALLIRSETKKTNEEKEKREQKLLKGKKEQLLLGSAKYSEEKDDAFFNEESAELCRVGAQRVKGNARQEVLDLDVIAKNFKSGETVNLNSLKEKGLVGENTQSIKILSKGNLTKPLVIEADEFSNAAKDALEISGGEAIEIKKN